MNVTFYLMYFSNLLQMFWQVRSRDRKLRSLLISVGIFIVISLSLDIEFCFLTIDSTGCEYMVSYAAISKAAV